MTQRKLFVTILLFTGLLVLPAQAQVPFGQPPVGGGVVQASCESGACDGGQLWGGYSDPDPSCGCTGLGYAGGFGSCDSCGVGGYFGRNIHPVDPCACGGSLIADLFMGVKRLVCDTVSTVLGTVFGGLQSASCHASGSFAALQCAAQSMGCSSCGTVCDGGCAGGPSCGMAGPSCGVSSFGGDEYITEGPIENGGYIHGPTVVPTPTDAMPLQSIQPRPIPTLPATSDPFTDDPVAPQARRQPQPVPAGYRFYTPRSGSVRPATHQEPVKKGNMIGSAVQRMFKSSSSKANPSQGRYLSSRPATLRR